MGLLALACAVLLRLTAPRGDEPADGDAISPVSAGLTAALMLLGLVLIGVFASPRQLSWGYGVVFLIGGFGALVTYCAARWRSDSSASASSAVFWGAGLALLEMAVLRNYFQDSPVVYIYTAALGTWLAVAVLVYGGSRSALGMRSFTLGSSAIAVAVAMGVYHYPKIPVGSLFAINVCSLVLLSSVLTALFVGIGGRARYVTAALAGAVLLGAIWWLGRMLGNYILHNVDGASCALVGAAAVLLLYVTASSLSDAESESGLPLVGRSEAAVLAVLIATAATAAAIRWLGGYGVTLAALGAFASLPLVYTSADRLSPSANAVPGRLALLAAAALVSVGFVRAFLEATSGYGVSVDIFQAYTVPGIVLGGALALMLVCTAAEWADVGGGSAVGAFFRGVVAVALGVAVVIAVTYFWRLDAVTGLVIGLAAGLFYAIVGAASRTERRAADLGVGLSLFTAALMPACLEATRNLTRDQKVSVLIWVLVGVAIMLIVASVARNILYARRDNQRSGQPTG